MKFIRNMKVIFYDLAVMESITNVYISTKIFWR